MRIPVISANLAWVGLLFASAGLAGCHPKSIHQAGAELAGGGAHISESKTLDAPVTISARLDCPEEQGALKRTAVGGDGRSCSYSSDQGGVVELALMDTPGSDVEMALAPLKAQIDAMLPRQAKGATIEVVSEKGPDGRGVNKVDLPFVHVSDDGYRSHVKILGLTIDSPNEDRHRHKAAAESDAGGRRGREFVYILAGAPASPEGYHAAGYVARGDGLGKLVVANFKYRKDDIISSRSGDHEDGDLDALVDRNAPKR